MRVGIFSVFVDYHRRGAHHREFLQPQIGPLIAALLPDDVEIDIINDTWIDPDWSRDPETVDHSSTKISISQVRSNRLVPSFSLVSTTPTIRTFS